MSTKVERRRAKDHKREKFSWKFFLRPGWILAILAIVAFSYASFSFLAPWQLGKDEDIVQRNKQLEQAFEQDPVPYQEVFDPEGQIEATEEWTRVLLTGQFLPDSEALLRLRPVEKTPVFQALTPFETNDGEIFLVNRGFVAFPGPQIPEIEPAPTNEVTITGMARLNETRPDNPPMVEQDRLQVYGINTGQVGEAVDLELAESYIQLSEGSAGELNAMPVPKLDRGSHLSYGWQWLAFGIMAPLGLGYFIWAEVRERRRVRREEDELAATEAGVTPDAGDETGTDARNEPDPEVVKPEDREATRSRDVRARYGGQHPDHWKRRSRH
ncbi:SURF1 family protein [Corynebacterium occultum]|uniref:SURF1-like protein n=1 Tax=Corynebacterium occultum TaxID=2675219 RepID=A0A6B8VUN4_9CORY|nr:SURF1 family protein [Corynebacterium occultum]QGU07893.1 SURF1 family protein [Corynebacterium occultum]